MMKRLEYLLVPNKEDKQIILKYTDSFRTKTDQDLLRICKQHQKLGIVGVRRQALCLVALRYVMKEQFGSSPIYIKSKYILGIDENSICYIDSN